MYLGKKLLFISIGKFQVWSPYHNMWVVILYNSHSPWYYLLHGESLVQIYTFTLPYFLIHIMENIKINIHARLKKQQMSCHIITETFPVLTAVCPFYDYRYYTTRVCRCFIILLNKILNYIVMFMLLSKESMQFSSLFLHCTLFIHQSLELTVWLDILLYLDTIVTGKRRKCCIVCNILKESVSTDQSWGIYRKRHTHVHLHQ